MACTKRRKRRRGPPKVNLLREALPNSPNLLPKPAQAVLAAAGYIERGVGVGIGVVKG
jgi:hypothetical protein